MIIQRLEDLIFYNIDVSTCQKCIENFLPEKPDCVTKNECIATKRPASLIKDFESFVLYQASLIASNDFGSAIKYLEKMKLDTAENIEILSFLRNKILEFLNIKSKLKNA